MLTSLGIDLAAQPQNTAACLIEWGSAGAEVSWVRTGADCSDDALVDWMSGAHAAESRAVLGAAPRDPRLDASAPQLPTVLVVVVAAIGDHPGCIELDSDGGAAAGFHPDAGATRSRSPRGGSTAGVSRIAAGNARFHAIAMRDFALLDTIHSPSVGGSSG